MHRLCGSYSFSLLLASLGVIFRPVVGFVVEDGENIQRRQQELSGVPSASNFISRAYHGTGQLGNFLYIDGGRLAFLKDGDKLNRQAPDAVEDNQTYSIDLTKGWTNSTVEFTAISKTAPVLNYQQLWTDKTRGVVYAYGGEQNSPIQSNQSQSSPLDFLWRFDPDDRGSGTWSIVSSTTDFNGIHRTTGGYYASGADVGVMLGGYISSETSVEDSKVITPGDHIPSPSLVMFNYSSQTWSNRSSTGFTQYGTAIHGQASVISGFGDHDVFAFFGGESSDKTFWNDTGSNLISFGKMYMYDPMTDSWFSQSTFGTTPEPRDRFCAVGLPGDNGTFEVFIFGGHVASNDGSEPSASESQIQKDRNTAMDQVFVLTFPGFVWHQADYPARWPRIEHSCQIAGNRQMIVVGGRNPASDDLKSFIFTPDPWPNGIGVFDLTLMQWSNRYDPNAAIYTTPQAVKEWYSQNGQYPSTWDNEQTEYYFKQTRAVSSNDRPQGTNNNSSSPTSSTAPSASSTSSSHAGVIAGSVIGAAAGLTLLGVLCWYLRNRSKQKSTAFSELGSSSDVQMRNTTNNSGCQELMGVEPKIEMPG